MAEPGLQRPGVVAGVGQGVAAGMPQHVGEDREGQAGALPEAGEQGAEALGRHRTAALRGEDVGRGLLLPLQTPQGVYLVALSSVINYAIDQTWLETNPVPDDRFSPKTDHFSAPIERPFRANNGSGDFSFDHLVGAGELSPLARGAAQSVTAAPTRRRYWAQPSSGRGGLRRPRWTGSRRYGSGIRDA